MAGRRLDQELMDRPGVPYEELETALRELDVINRWLGGFRTTRIGVEQLIRDLPAGTSLSVLDVGSGGTDLREVLKPLGREFTVTALDINPLVHEYAGRHGNGTEAVTASAHGLEYPDRSFDIVHTSLFLHHCTDAEAALLIQRAARIARLGVVINDLHRSRIALVAISFLTTLFSHSPIVRFDAPLSVRRGFTRRELAAVLADAGFGDAALSRHWAFRWCLCITATRGRDNGRPV